MKSLITLFVSFMLVGFAFTQSTINFDLKTYLDNKFTDMDNKFTDMDNKFTELKEDNQRLEGKVEQKFSTLYSVLTAVVVGFVTLFFPFIFRLYREWIFGGNKQTPLNKEDMQEVMEKVFKQPFLQLSQNQENDYLTKEFLEKEQSRFKKDLLPQLKKDLLSQLKKDLLPQLKKDLLLEKKLLKKTG